MKTSALGWPCRADPNIRVINVATGEPLRELVLKSDRDYQSTGHPPGPLLGTPTPCPRRKTRTPNPNVGFGVISMSCDITSVGLAGFEPATSATQTRRASQTALQPVPTRV
jgi:hypothetical protein